MKKKRPFQGKHILILEGYARQCLPFMRSFKEHGCEITLLCGSKMDLGYASRYPDHKIVGVCDPERYQESSDYICDLIRSNRYDLVLPLVDFSARILSENKEELSRYAVIASNDQDVFKLSQDKLSVMKLCMLHNIPCPKTLCEITTKEELEKASLDYPIVIKPRRGCGARGFHCFQNREELIAFDKVILWKDYVVQEYIPQTNSNLAVNMYVDKKGIIRTAFTYASRRWFPLKGGTGTLNELIDRPDAVEICERLVKLLGLRGYIGFDLIDDPRDGIPKVIEINPRILACAKIGFDGGVDQAAFVLEDSFGDRVETRTNYRNGIFVRMSQIDMLWFLKSPNRFRATPSWFSIKKTKDQIFYLDDPLPWFAFSLTGVFKYKKEMKKRQ